MFEFLRKSNNLIIDGLIYDCETMPYTFKQILEKIAGEKAPGPSTTFSLFHILNAIEIMAKQPIGRGMLAENLKVGEGAIRTIINRLQKAGLIATSKAGCVFTKKGLSLWKEYKSIFKEKIEIGKNELTLAEYNFAILVKNHAHKVKSGIEQRDAAVMAGAKSATTLLFKGQRLLIPSVSNNVAKDFPKAANQILKLLKPEENDAIIIVSASSPEKAQYGTLAAAWALLN
jgi:predicted transcriptional regulator